MSVAFRRESDDEHLEPKFEIPIPPGPNLVTARGLAMIGQRVSDLELGFKMFVIALAAERNTHGNSLSHATLPAKRSGRHSRGSKKGRPDRSRRPLGALFCADQAL